MSEDVGHHVCGKTASVMVNWSLFVFMFKKKYQKLVVDQLSSANTWIKGNVWITNGISIQLITNWNYGSVLDDNI